MRINDKLINDTHLFWFLIDTQIKRVTFKPLKNDVVDLFRRITYVCSLYIITLDGFKNIFIYVYYII